MPNDTGLSPGDFHDNYFVSEQSSCYPVAHGVFAMEKPSEDSIYYLIHTGLEYGTIYGGYSKYLYYTVVDMRLQNGLGDIVDENHILLEDTLGGSGRLAACKHANGRDWWIVMQEAETNCFYTCLLTPQGIDSVGKQCIGDTTHQQEDVSSNVFTPDGSKYIWSSPIYEHLNILDFDRCTGIFSNHRRYNIIDSLTRATGNTFRDGVAVSPNSRYLYLTTGTEVRQFDLQADSIDRSEIIIDNTWNGYPKVGVMFSQLAPDGKIYVCPSGQDTFLHVINYPDSAGLACGFVRNAVKLPSYNIRYLPNFPNYRLGALVGSGCDSLPTNLTPTLSKGEGVIQVYPNPASEYLIVDYGNVEWSAENVVLEIYNAIGETVYKTQLPRYSALQKIATVNWSKGVYFVTVKQAGIYAKPIKWVKE